MFKKKAEKRVVELNPSEVRLLLTALMNFRNKVAKTGRPTEDINELIRRADDLLYFVKTGEKGNYAFL